MNDASSHGNNSTENSPAVRTVSEARRWLAGLAQNGVSDVQVKEPFQPVGGGLVIVQASLVREDGVRVNVAVYCYDDTPPAAVDWLPPIPAKDADGRFQDGNDFR